MFRSLSELVELNPNFQCPNTLEPNDLVSFIPMGDVSDSGHWMTKRTKPLKSVRQGFTPFANGDVLFAKITPCMENGKGAHVVGLANAVGFGSTEFHVLRPKQEADARFIFHHTQHRELRSAAEAAMTGSAGQKRVPTEFFHKWKVYSPSKEEQSRIAQILDILDSQIQKTEALIAKLEKIKEGLLHDLLTRGIDHNGQLRPTPDQAPELYRESALGLIPKKWVCSEIENLLDCPSRSGLYKPSAFHGYGAPMIQMGNIFSSEFVSFEKISRVSVTPSELEIFGLENGDILFARRSLVLEGAGKASLVKDLPEPSTFESSIVRLRLRHDAILPSFAIVFLQSSFSYSDRRKYIRQVAVSGVSSSDIRQFLCLIPPLEEQQTIISRVESSRSRIEAERKALGKLKKQKAGLMDDLLTGRVRVTPLMKDAV